MPAPTMTTEILDREIVFRRVLNAPRELVFKAWTDASQLAKWFGPSAFTARAETDPRIGGEYRITMIGPDGKEYPMKGEYKEVAEPSRLVFTVDNSGHDKQWQEMLGSTVPAGEDFLRTVSVVELEDAGDTTNLTVRCQFASNAVRDAYMKMQMSDGWRETLEGLNDFVEKRYNQAV